MGNAGRGADAFHKWEAGIAPILRAAMAALDACDRTYDRRWSPALVANADQLSAASRTILRWVQGNACPHADLDTMLTRLARSYCYLAAVLETHGDGSLSWLLVDRELRSVHSAMTRTLTMMYQRARLHVEPSAQNL